MHLTEAHLQKIIKEEIETLLLEAEWPDGDVEKGVEWLKKLGTGAKETAETGMEAIKGLSGKGITWAIGKYLPQSKPEMVKFLKQQSPRIAGWIVGDRFWIPDEVEPYIKKQIATLIYNNAEELADCFIAIMLKEYQ
jgi:hypothetical protein